MLPAAETASPAPLPARPRGQPKSPWRLRKETEAQALASLEAELVKAVQEGRGHEVLYAAEVALARVSFSKFCQLAWHVLEPSTHLDWGRHHELICTTMQALFEDWYASKQDKDYIPHIRNVVFNLPPGSLKSRIMAVMFQAWCWIRSPGMKLVCISVNEAAALRDARDTRALMASDWYQTCFQPDWSIKDDQDAITDFGNTSGGNRLSKPSGSVIVGLRGDCVAGETMVSTEIGDVRIDWLHSQLVNGLNTPRVWSMNIQNNRLELKRIVTSRCIPNRNVVDVLTQTNKRLRCTSDHRIYCEGEYTPASYLAGRRVSVLQRSDLPIKTRDPATLCELSLRDTDVCTLRESIQTSRCGVRQKKETRSDCRPILQQELQDEGYSTARDHSELFTLRKNISDKRKEGAGSLFSKVLSHPRCRTRDQVRTDSLSTVQNPVQAGIITTDILCERVCKQGAFRKNERGGELELFGERQCSIHRYAVAEPCSVNSGEGRESLHGVQFRRFWETGVTCASYRRESKQQCSRKSYNALRHLSHDSPQTGRETILSVNPATEGDREVAVDVYDIQVEGNHNFFADGILVHNCLIVDDANDPEKAYEEAERNKVNSLWDTNQYNRVNDPLRSLRVCIQQRVHVEDHTGHIIKKQGVWSPDNPDGWLHVVLPAEFEPNRTRFELPEPLRKRVRHLPGAEIRDWRTKEGEALHPARMTPSFLASEKKRWAGTSNYAGQMQQRPTAEGGGAIKKEWFGWFRLASGVRPDIDEHETGRPRPAGCEKNETIIIPAAHHRPGHWDFDLVVLSVDPAYKKTDRGSLWGMLAFGCKGARRYLLDDRSQRGQPDEAILIMKDLVRVWNPDKILIEDKAGGAGMYRTLEIEMGNGDVPMVELELVNPGTQDKIQRVNSVIPALANGMLYLREGASWLEDYVDELASFPAGVTMDRTDATTQVFAHIRVEDVAFPSASAWSKASGY